MLQAMLEPSAISPETVRPLLRVEYDRLVELGVFGDEKIELLCGQLVTMSPQGDDHAEITTWFLEALFAALLGRYQIRAHSPFAASDDSEPEPDLSVSIKPPRRRGHPTQALLLIEISDSSLRKDRTVKAAIYAHNGAPEYWVVDVAHETVEVHTEPRDGCYTRVAKCQAGDTLRAVAIPELAIAVAGIPWRAD